MGFVNKLIGYSLALDCTLTQNGSIEISAPLYFAVAERAIDTL